ncbi:MAG: spore coat protein CotJB [Peptococcaceae bacterium]|nr:spore coat protein CotJB [Peptococcaceae bacterium]MBQ2859867.1 spore coat protein CotJB [Peptococcaceae bacterium]MBQ3508556.1 spore coat protein CotJB [Peptococcaceae bacterium]MBR2627312.1 spore coat protein CotJB [Peptococcaceae bacterium]
MKKYNAGPAGTSRNREAALLELQQLSFSLVDLNLFLDTHPDSQQAINDYNELFEQYWEAKSSFELLYGPLNNFGHCPASYPWSWINDPWPWEKGGAV